MALTDLPRWQAKYGPNAVAAIFGDSTSDGSADPQWAAALYEEFRALTAPGRALYGLQAKNILDAGTAGERTLQWLTDSSARVTRAQLAAAAPDLIVMSFGINDARDGHTASQITGYLTTVINAIRSDLPNVDLILRIPLFCALFDPGFPLTLLHDAYMALDGVFDHCVIWDAQASIYGGRYPSVANQCYFMYDPWHPSDSGYTQIARNLAREEMGRVRDPIRWLAQG